LSFIYSPMANVRNKPSLSMEQSRPQPRVLSTDTTFTCPLCSEILTSRTNLLRHVGSKHTESLFAICKTCLQCFEPKDIDGHMSACKGPYVCPYCRHTFALIAYLNRHVRRKHSTDDENRAPNNIGGGGPRYACKFCSNTFSSNNALNIHIQRHLNLVCNSCGSKMSRESIDLVACSTCGNRLSSGDIETNDQQMCDKKDGRKDEEIPSSSPPPQDANAVPLRMPQFTCPYCQRLYVSLTCFRKHLATHAPSQPVISSSAASAATNIGGRVAATVVTRPLRRVSEGSTSSSAISSNDAFFKDFTEEDWMQADSYLCLSQPQNLNLLHSIVYEGANLEFL
uniref:C2H2-type domain-containing protein n=1 Tax=Hymenolepis diminuta TaxID=6216 RepID=A0A0R3SEW5_HYMDI